MVVSRERYDELEEKNIEVTLTSDSACAKPSDPLWEAPRFILREARIFGCKIAGCAWNELAQQSPRIFAALGYHIRGATPGCACDHPARAPSARSPHSWSAPLRLSPAHCTPALAHTASFPCAHSSTCT